MNVFFEESGDFKVGTVLSQAGEAYQVELASGKRSKVKSKDVLIQFDKPEPEALLAAASSALYSMVFLSGLNSSWCTMACIDCGSLPALSSST